MLRGEQGCVNAIGMTLARIKAGCFRMGQNAGGDADEKPVHKVHISRPFLMSVTPVTNAQYEQFDPAHRDLRGIRGLSRRDDEAVVCVTWHDAVRFCMWLSEKEGKPYRLPTEAEWEYACRAGTVTAYNTGKTLPEEYHRNQDFVWVPRRVSLAVGKTRPNRWGLCDMHGLVEEWCHDWYGPYEKGEQRDPVGRASGLFRVTRGGSHNTEVTFLRSASRLGTLAEDKQWLIGFRVVQGEMPKTRALPASGPPLCMSKVSRRKARWPRGPEPNEPLFSTPVCYIKPPIKGSLTPFHKYHHQPDITWCPNGDLLAAWFTTNAERGRELAVVASRLRAGRKDWDPVSEFFKAPDRNMTGTALFHDGEGTIYHANGLSEGGGWSNLALVVRTSKDSGATWSPPAIVNGHRLGHNQVIAGTSVTKEGHLIQPCDAWYPENVGTTIQVSRDRGKTWIDPAVGVHKWASRGEASGRLIAGIHAGVVRLRDGRLMALGRGNNIGGRMPMSISDDMGETWTYRATEFPRISSCQRHVLMRLREGPLLLVSFTDTLLKRKHFRGIAIADAASRKRKVFGMFAALSMDEGKSWPIKRLMTDDASARTMRTHDGRTFTMSPTTAEPSGYLAATQTPDGIIHLVSSYLYYRFNLTWLQTPAPAF